MVDESRIPQTVSYDLLQAQFKGLNLAEAQGVLVALLYSTSFDHFKDWLQELDHIRFDESPLNEEILKILYDKTLDEMNSTEFNLRLLIAEEEHLKERVQGFIRWCHGFSYGFGLSSELYARLDEDGKDFIRYIVEFSSLDTEEVLESLGNEEDKLALEELVEFVRMGALMLYFHLKDQPKVH
ncbi:YecA family protein [Ignatzschineria rhizosphaerae]|uniref:YecA family protein n=1 Tax=Ignatzschineria rhizosphaerae TaxID=2923279 RepID=A0ABY3X2H5_9GAMM|nr:YecA family protein [Ignatzschineria rhizosphaerae]UNM95212.1 YecA family protein [Ignatzschineria rhizosphaerae]